LIQSHHFDKQREIERKKHVKALLNRTPAQLQEEEFIYIETRRLEQNLLKRIKNRDELMKIIGGFHHHMLNEMKFWPIVEPSPTTLQLSRLAISNSINNAHPAEDGSRSSHPSHQPDKRNAARRDEHSLDEGPVSASGGVGGEGQEMNLDPQAEMEEDKKHCIQRLDSRHPTGSSSGSTTHYRTVGLRSTRITLPKTAAASSRLSTVMNELQIPNLLTFLPKPLIMPTRENVESYERLMQAANQLVDLRRLADRVDADLKAHRKKKDALLANLTSSSADDTLPAPTKTAPADHPVRPSSSNPGNESAPDVPTHPEPDHRSEKSTTSHKKTGRIGVLVRRRILPVHRWFLLPPPPTLGHSQAPWLPLLSQKDAQNLTPPHFVCLFSVSAGSCIPRSLPLSHVELSLSSPLVGLAALPALCGVL